MARLLIITDQPIYETCPTKLASASLMVDTIFAGDIAENKLSTTSLKKNKYDMILHPATVTIDTPGGKDVFDFIYGIRENTDNCRVSVYANQY